MVTANTKTFYSFEKTDRGENFFYLIFSFKLPIHLLRSTAIAANGLRIREGYEA